MVKFITQIQAGQVRLRLHPQAITFMASVVPRIQRAMQWGQLELSSKAALTVPVGAAKVQAQAVP